MYCIHVAFCHEYRFFFTNSLVLCSPVTHTAIQYPELDCDSRQTMWSNMLAGEANNISRRDIEELSRIAVNGK
jgi:hypothetical protein